MAYRPDLSRLIELQSLLLRFRAVEREIHTPGNLSKRENDSEHSYDLAMAGWFLAEYFPSLDRDKIIRLCLAHDLVEIHAGDTFAYGKAAAKAGKKSREQNAANKLATDWPDFPELSKAIQEYKTRKTEESRFVYALDKIMPAIMVYLADGFGWHKHNITIEDFRAEKENKVSLSPEILPYYRELHDLILSNSKLMPKTKIKTPKH